MARDKRDANNVLGEWFGHRVYPVVASRSNALADQRARRCPFLTVATETERQCVKAEKSVGVCTVSSTSNGPRQDWLVCPYRAMDPKLLEDATRRMFAIQPSRGVVIHAANALARDAVRAEVSSALARGTAAFVFMQDKFGGEVSLSATQKSPELSFDVTIVELVQGETGPTVDRYAILEVQTMDFHGSYSHAVANLKDALRLHPVDFHRQVELNVGWLSNKIEGPNIANVFKRTLYQMLLKFRLAGQGACVGATLAVPAAVWDSWQRHLGAPLLTPADNGTFRLAADPSETEVRAWIYVFDLDATSTESPNPIIVQKVIGTDAEAVAHFAFKVAPDAVLAEGGSGSLVVELIRKRLASWWPELGPPKRGRRPRT